MDALVPGSRAKSSRRKGRPDSRINDLKKLIEQKKATIVKGVLSLRKVEQSLVDAELSRKSMRDFVVTAQNIGKKCAYPFHYGRNIELDEVVLKLIESSARANTGMGYSIQKGINSFNDVQLNAILRECPVTVLQDNAESFKLFNDIALAASGGYIRGREIHQIFRSAVEFSNSENSKGVPLWTLLKNMLRKYLLLVHLTRVLYQSSGEGLIAIKPSFTFPEVLSLSPVALSRKALMDDVSLSRSMSQGGDGRHVNTSKSLTMTGHHSTSMLKKRKMSGNFAENLSNQFTKSQSLIKSTYDGLVTNLSWVTQSIAIPSEFTSAKQFAKKLAIKKFGIVIVNKALRKKNEALTAWKKYCLFNQYFKQSSYIMKIMQAFRVANAIQSSLDRQLGKGFKRFYESKKWFVTMEKFAATFEIQRYWRGALARSHIRHAKQFKAASFIAALVRGKVARNHAKKIKETKRRRNAAIAISYWWLSLGLKRCLARKLAIRKQIHMALRIQRLFRGHRSRVRVKSLKIKRKRNKMATKIQSIFRKYKAVLFIELYKQCKRAWNAAVVVQRQYRRRLACKVVAELRFRNGCAMVIQHAWLCYRARVMRRKLYIQRCATNIQRVIRGHLGRKRFIRIKEGWDKVYVMRRAAIRVIAPIILGYAIRRRIGPILIAHTKARNRAASIIQKRWEAVLIARKVREEYLWLKKVKAFEEAEMQRRKDEEKKRHYSATLIQKRYRGVRGRRKAARVKKDHEIMLARKTRIPMYYRLKTDYFREQNTFHRPYVLRIQAAFRGKLARTKVYHLRRKIAASRIARAWRLYVACRGPRRALRILKARHAHITSAVIKIQTQIRIYLAKCTADRHRQMELVLWFMREFKAKGITGLAIRNFRRRKAEELRKNRAATKIQACYRGLVGRRRVRRLYKQLVRHRAVVRQNVQIRAATKIQCLIRQYLAKCTVMARRIQLAREAEEKKEMALVEEKLDVLHEDWMNDLMAIRAQTGVRGMLANRAAGRLVVERQAMLLERERMRKYRAATKIQAWVRGIFSRRLFKRQLPFLRKQQQVRRFCVECESNIATRRCMQCKDRYCEECYTILHRKGTRKNHSWEPVRAGGVAQQSNVRAAPEKLHTNQDGAGDQFRAGSQTQSNDAFPVQSTFSAQVDNQSVKKKADGPIMGSENPWQEYYDSGAKAKYWFNTKTGEATWVKPS